MSAPLMPKLEIRDLGLVAYDEAYALQKELVALKRSEPTYPDVLLLLEHPDVYTSGRKSRSESAVHKVAIERGGEDTFHNPGQLVAYPILSLREKERDLHKYLRSLEEVVIGTLSDFGVEGERRHGATGVWIRGENKKIASLGVAVSGWVTYHGLALNVSNDLTGFDGINPCGFQPSVMTSLEQRLGADCPAMSEVKRALENRFLIEFSRRRVALPTGALVG
jgi:lipoyl(octanoyl) transferase